MTDIAPLIASRYSVRDAYCAIRRLRSTEPAVVETLDRLDALCCWLTSEIEAADQQLCLEMGR